MLNADVMNGPGMRWEEGLALNGDTYTSECLSTMDCAKIFFSFGWVVDPRSAKGYTASDIERMHDLIKKYQLEDKSAGIILAVNARILRKCYTYVSRFMFMVRSDLIVFSSKAEPPVSFKLIDDITNHFRAEGIIDRVGFDCQVSPSRFMSLVYDNMVRVSMLYHYTINRAIAMYQSRNGQKMIG